MPKKYVFINGVMQLNPEYEHPSGKKDDQKQHEQMLAVVSTPADVVEMKKVYDEQENPDDKVEVFFVHANVSAAQAIMEDEQYVGSFAASSSAGSSLFDQLLQNFEMYEVPIGLMYKLLELRNFKIHFLIDDSGSMQSGSDAPYTEAHPSIPRGTGNMTRIVEEENRLHIFIDILAYIPTKGIRLMFMNTNLDITLLQAGRSPEEFKAEAHASIRNAFSNLSYGLTPTYTLLTKSFGEAASSGIPTHHYLLTDGVPSDKSADQVGRLIQNRANPKTNPVTLISCTNVDSECEWMKDIEEYAPYTSECDDYHDEKAEVLKDQGTALPYTRGFWLIGGLVAAMNPDDLDAMDESVPFTRYTLNELLGRSHTPAEYQFYWKHNPHSSKYSHMYERFLSEQCASSVIVPKSQRPQVQSRSAGGGGGDDGCCVVM